MKYYLGACGIKGWIETFPVIKHHDKILISLAYLDFAYLDELTIALSNKELMFDSGAFTNWTKNKTSSLQQVTKQYQILNERFPNATYINLDIIPGLKGKKPTASEANEACEQSWQNYLKLSKTIPNILPVFHEDDNWKYLEMMKDHTDYIAISPANDSHNTKRMKWLDKVYSNLKADYKTHGLAATGKTIQRRYPFYSADSMSYLAFAMYGNARSVSKKHAKILRKQGDIRHYVSRLLHKEVAHIQQEEAQITKLWSRRGVNWDD